MASDAGLVGNPGQTNYGSAKAGIAAFTVISAAEIGRYGVRVNCIVPMARTRLTTETPGAVGEIMSQKPPEGELDIYDPANTAAVIAYLASDEAKDISGRVFHTQGGRIDLMSGWRSVKTIRKEKTSWEVSELVNRMKELMEGVEAEDLSQKMMWSML
jgi:NAD(P)-dependent dehydrogenase (short-subunit alcohol dehydrogenase family)